MSRPYHKLTLAILEHLAQKGETAFGNLHKAVSPATLYKEFYNNLFRMAQSDLIEKTKKGSTLVAKITPEGRLLLGRKQPLKDGVWKMVIFDIPEKHKKVRNILRAKLKALNFKKWQNSIYISPFVLDAEIEDELNQLAKKFFVRLIKTTQINSIEDLEKLFG